jgi:hypothetical protein
MSKSKKLISLDTTTAVIEAVGGTSQAAGLTRRSYTAAFNWHAQHTFPSNTYVVLQTALAQRGYTALPSLWGMTVAAEAAA